MSVMRTVKDSLPPIWKESPSLKVFHSSEPGSLASQEPRVRIIHSRVGASKVHSPVP